MTDYEKLKIRELHLIASALVELVNCKCVENADYDNLDDMVDDYNALDDCVSEMCRLDGEKIGECLEDRCLGDEIASAEASADQIASEAP